jgi:hypothetical protein
LFDSDPYRFRNSLEAANDDEIGAREAPAARRPYQYRIPAESGDLKK